MIPTLEEYQKAKEITIAYENEQKRLFQLKVEDFRIELQSYFDNNLIDGFIKLEKFELNGDCFGGEIIPIKPNLEERYDGGNNDDIEEICKKHGVNFRFAYWCYHK